MLIPFLPYLLALAGLSAVDALRPEGEGTALLSGVSQVLLYLALPLLGLLVERLPAVLVGRRGMGRMRARGLFLLLWLGVLASVPLTASLTASLAWVGDGGSAALAALMLNYWVGDALCQSAHPAPGAAAGLSRRQRLGMALRMPLPILVLLLAGLALPGLSDELLLPLEPSGGWAWARALSGLVVLVGVAAVGVPVLIRLCWGLRPLADRTAERVMRDELAANGVRVAAVLAWPEALLGHSTAGVIGLLPRFRYLLVSPSLLEALAPDELQAVTAHEAGHLKHRHLWFFLAAIVGFSLLMQVLAAGAFWTGLYTGTMLPAWLLVVLEVAALVVFFRFGIGYLSRHFERQADGNALRRTGPAPFEGALMKVGLLNGIPVEQNNWHHYGISHRIGYARRATDDPERLARHDRKVTRVKAALLALVALGFAGQAAAMRPDTADWLGERLLTAELQGDSVPDAKMLPAMQFLASRAVEQGNLRRAERLFRGVLRARPDDPQTQNNLAWVLVTRPQPEPGELREGLHLAEQAARADEQAYIWDTLAESYYRLHRIDAAIRASAKALDLAEADMGRGVAPLSYYRERLESFRRQSRGA